MNGLIIFSKFLSYLFVILFYNRFFPFNSCVLIRFSEELHCYLLQYGIKDVSDLCLLYSNDEIILLEDLQPKITKEEFSRFLEAKQKTSLLSLKHKEVPSDSDLSPSPSSTRPIPSLDDPSSIQSIVLNTGDEVIPIFSSSPPVPSSSFATDIILHQEDARKQDDGSSPLSSDFALPFFASRGRSGSKGSREEGEPLDNNESNSSSVNPLYSGPSLLTTHFLPCFNQEHVTMKDVTASVMGKPVIVDEIANHGKLFRDSSSTSVFSYGMSGVGKENNNDNNLQLVPTTTSPSFTESQRPVV
jgi:hypothetical protein